MADCSMSDGHAGAQRGSSSSKNPERTELNLTGAATLEHHGGARLRVALQVIREG